MRTDYIHELACSLKKKYKTSNPFVLAEKLNIYVKFKYLEDLKGFYTVSQRNRFICIDNGLDETMAKIVACHELGHDQLHRNMTQFFTKSDIYNMTNIAEYEANLFTAEILIEDNKVIQILKSGYDFFTCAKILYVDRNLLSIKLHGMNNRGYKVNIPVEYKGDFLK